jgi:hypothetical protein
MLYKNIKIEIKTKFLGIRKKIEVACFEEITLLFF